MGKITRSYKNSLGKRETKGPLGRPILRRIILGSGFKEIGC
jgi:hypothetical protein